MSSTDRLMARTMSFVDFNVTQYISHRRRGEYREAVERLRRLSGLLATIDQAKRENRGRLSHADQTTVDGIQRHVDAMFGKLPDNIECANRMPA
jgi:hypothetical protein